MDWNPHIWHDNFLLHLMNYTTYSRIIITWFKKRPLMWHRPRHSQQPPVQTPHCLSVRPCYPLTPFRQFNVLHNSLGYNFGQYPHNRHKRSIWTDPETITDVVIGNEATTTTFNKEEVTAPSLVGHLIKIPFLVLLTGALSDMFRLNVQTGILWLYVRDSNLLPVLLTLDLRPSPIGFRIRV